MKTRWSINITPAERVARIVIGLIGAVGGVLIFAGASMVSVGILGGLLILTGLDLVVTGAIGHCPLYQQFGHVPASLRRKTS